jgi:hypothetical protein
MKLRWLIILPLVSWASYEAGWWYRGYVISEFWRDREEKATASAELPAMLRIRLPVESL